MRNHERLHRRQGRDAFPNPEAIASAIAEAFPNPFAQEETKGNGKKNAATTADSQRTVVSVVYVTASATFDGPIGGYKTLGVDDNNEDEKTTRTTQAKTTVQAEPTTRQEQPTKQTSIAVDTSQAKPKSQTTLNTLPSEINSPTGALTSSLAVVAATGSVSRSSVLRSTPTLSSAQSSSSAEAVKSEGMSAGGKAGLAIGILLLIGAILALVLFVFKRRKEKAKKEQEEEEEKAAMYAASRSAASANTNTPAPRLSLRPVTQFLPNLGEKRTSRGNVLTTMAAAAPQPQHQQQSQEQNRNNPFGNHAEAIDSTNANGPSPVQLNGPDGEIIVAAAASGATAGLARGASKRGEKPQDFTTKNVAMRPISPSGTEFSQTSDANSNPAQSSSGAAAIAAAGGPANSAVHRVQLDFKPSMEDELELRAGQLIRLLHEYDDGWALCIRLDRSQQGVVPRTCLSTRPVKPRPQQPPQGQRGPPPGQRGPPGQMRPMSPAMNGPPRGPPGMNQGQRPASPSGRNSPGPQYNGQRPMTPQGAPRPMTPQGQPRPMTPQGQNRPRSPSVAQQQARRNSPPGPSPMNPSPNQPQLSSSPPNGAPIGRKPVPGQAL